MTTTTRALAAAALVLAACAGAPPVPPPAPPPPAPRAPARPVAPQTDATGAPLDPLSVPGRRLFDEAVAIKADMDKAKAVDWSVLEHRWRAVLQVEEVAEARFNLGVALEQQGRLIEARGEYQRALAAKPLRQASANLGVVQEKEGDLRGALAIYDATARDYPDDVVARERLAAIYRGSGQLEESWHYAREALLRDPGSVSACKTMIRVALARGDLDLAKLVALRAQKLAPDDAEVAYLSGLLVWKQGDEAGATVQWKKALALRPGLRPARAGLLELAVKQERWTEVQELSAGLLADDPSNASLELLLGIARRHSGKPDEALAAYQNAEQLAAGKLPEVFLARAILQMRDKNDCESALRSFEQYERSAGPVLPQGSPAPRLMRECREMQEQSRAAAEAVRQMQAEAEKKKAAEEAAKAPAVVPPAAPPATPVPPAPTPAPAPSGSTTKMK